MNTIYMTYSNSKTCLLLCLILLSFTKTNAQFIIKDDNISKKSSIHQYTEFIDVKNKELTLSEVQQIPASKFKYIPNENFDFGFTASNIWLKFKLKNETNIEQLFYFETARPITDIADLYIIKADKTISKLSSGDAIPYHKRNIDVRKTIFKISLKPHEIQQFYLHIKSDGEMLSMPLVLHRAESLLEESAFEQFVFGFFYGILIIAAILYLFFFFGLRDTTFFYYSMYVVFIGLLQFSVDGYFYKFITPNAGWFSLHAVAIFACVANFFLGRYAQVFLKIIDHNTVINKAFYILYVLDGLLLVSLFAVPNALEYAYPLANGLGLILLLLIIALQISVYNKTNRIDKFFSIGILFLICGFVVFILKNFSILPFNFWTENGSKIGTGIEMIFLSLSMANLIRQLKNEKQELQTIALQKSEEMNELKSYFLSNISHELRTPLNAILNTAKTIASSTKDEQIVNNSQIIKYSTYSLLSSVNDILDFSKIEKNEIKLEVTDFDLIKTVEHISNNFKRQAIDKGIEFTFQKGESIPSVVKGDVVRLSQIVHNVLSNAVKFTYEGSIQFKVEAKTADAHKTKILFTINDTGVGIPKEKINSIFDSFTQESINDKRKFGGLGLGLFIVKSLVQLQNGKVDIQSQIGLGTVCTIELDYEIVNDKALLIAAETKEEFDLQGKRILVVEDNAMNQMVIKMITKKWLNTTVEFANNGEEGVNQLKENHYDIILMDLQMPIMDGYEATIAIRKGEAGEKNKNIPIIAVTADVMETTKERVMEIGMNKYLSKPINKEDLFKSIKALL